MHKDERGIVSKVSNEGGSVGKFIISSNRLDWVRGWPRLDLARRTWLRLSQQVGASASGLSAQIPASMGT